MTASSKVLHVVGASDLFVTELLDAAVDLKMDVRILPVHVVDVLD